MAAPNPPRARFLLLVLVLAGVTLITLSDRKGSEGVFQKIRSYAVDVTNPVSSGVHSALQPVGDFIYGAFEYRSLERENQLLRRELLAAETASVEAAAEEAQAQAVLSQQHLDILARVPSVAAQVVGLGSANFEQTVEINRGSADGVAVGEPVTSAGGLVGSVTNVSAHLATVTLMDDPSFTVGVRDLRSGVIGAALGEGEGNPLEVIGVNVGQPVKKGDELITSGLSLEHFPAGIPVGTVSAVGAVPGVLQLAISMKPLADLSNLEYVRVLLWSPQ
jgi:rod shape-determining protein MreC